MWFFCVLHVRFCLRLVAKGRNLPLEGWIFAVPICAAGSAVVEWDRYVRFLSIGVEPVRCLSGGVVTNADPFKELQVVTARRPIVRRCVMEFCLWRFNRVVDRPACRSKEVRRLRVANGLHCRSGNDRENARRDRRGDRRPSRRRVARVLVPCPSTLCRCRPRSLSRWSSHGRNEGRASSQRAQEGEGRHGGGVGGRRSDGPPSVVDSVRSLRRRGLLSTAYRVHLYWQCNVDCSRWVRRLSEGKRFRNECPFLGREGSRQVGLYGSDRGNNGSGVGLYLASGEWAKGSHAGRVVEDHKRRPADRSSNCRTNRRNDGNNFEHVGALSKFCCRREEERQDNGDNERTHANSNDRRLFPFPFRSVSPAKSGYSCVEPCLGEQPLTSRKRPHARDRRASTRFNRRFLGEVLVASAAIVNHAYLEGATSNCR